jgi:hypothetical protein
MWISEHCFPVGKDVLLYLKLSRRDKFERDLMGSAVDLWERRMRECVVRKPCDK